jgi:hypothetical protein
VPSAVLMTALSAYRPGFNFFGIRLARNPMPSTIFARFNFFTRLPGTVQFLFPSTLPQRWSERIARDDALVGETVTAVSIRLPRLTARRAMSLAVTAPTCCSLARDGPPTFGRQGWG